MKFIRPLIATALLTASMSVMAADTGWYIAADAGRSQDKDTQSAIDSAFIGAGATAYSSSYDKSDTSYSLLAGYQFNRNFALEGGYIDLGKRDFTATYTGGAANGSTEADAWKLSAVGILPVNESFSVTGKAHMIYSDVKVSLAATGPGGAAAGSASDHSWDFGLGLGVEYKFNPQLAIRGNWDQYSKVGDNSTTGESDIRVFSVGLKYSF